MKSKLLVSLLSVFVAVTLNVSAGQAIYKSVGNQTFYGNGTITRLTAKGFLVFDPDAQRATAIVGFTLNNLNLFSVVPLENYRVEHVAGPSGTTYTIIAKAESPGTQFAGTLLESVYLRGKDTSVAIDAGGPRNLPRVFASSARSIARNAQTGVTVSGEVTGTYTLDVKGSLASNLSESFENAVTRFTAYFIGRGYAQYFPVPAVSVPTNTPPNPVEFALIPAAEFSMGDALDGDADANAPVHSVNVSAFYMGKNLTTKGEWDDVRTWALSHGYTFNNSGLGKAADHPVHTINWYDVVKWCNARSEQEGLTPCYQVGGAVMRSGTTEPTMNWLANGYRLPTEAEWEKAARGGLSGKRFPWGDTITYSQANYTSSTTYSYDISPTPGYHPTYGLGAAPYTSPVGSFAPNGYGLNDMAGNVFEWCWDWYGTYDTGTPTDPRGATSGSNRVLRGGAWSGFAFGCRVAYRGDYGPTSAVSVFGFRVARRSVP